MSINNGLRAAYNTFTEPAGAQNDLDVSKRQDEYLRRWSYFKNQMFSKDSGADFSLYLSGRGLYQHTKLIFNPVPEIVNFYIDNIWQTPNNKLFPNLATPLTEETDENIIAAVAQLDQWTNWRTEANRAKAYAAASGNVLIEGHIDYDRQKITQKIIWASYVSAIELNDAGDVVSYALEYDVREANQTYRYKKICDKEKSAYFRDDRAFATETRPAVEENKLGFCFAVWLKHSDDGGTAGIPAVHNFDKVDHTNSLASHLHDNIHKEIESGKIIGVDDPSSIEIISGATKDKNGIIQEFDTRLERVLLAAKGNVSVHDLAGVVKLADAHPYLKELIASFADDYPELQARAIIKESSQLSGAALERMLTSAQNRLDRAAANYDQQLIKLRQMQLAAGGLFLNDLKSKTTQQNLFAAFSLESYERGQIDFQLKRSLLVEATEDEREDILTKKTNRAAASTFAGRAEQLRIAGYSDERIEEILTLAEAAPVGAPPSV